MDAPSTHYARSGDANIAYQVVGDGPIDLVYVIGWVSNIDLVWQEPSYARFLRRLASFSRLILFDKRGTGLSDRVSIDQLPTMEQRMDDVRAVMDAANSERATLFGVSEGGPLCALFAATYPERTTGLVIVGGYANGVRVTDSLGARTQEEWERMLHWLERHWGDDAARETLRDRAPSVYADAAFRDWWARYLRSSVSPTAMTALSKMNRDIDVRPALPAISAPTLIMHARADRAIRVDNGRFLGKSIRGARYIEFDSQDHMPWAVQADADLIAASIEELLTGRPSLVESSRVLVTVLYTDIVESTVTTAAVGDERWVDVMASHDAIARRQIERSRGKLVKTLGDGILATFDGPARAIRCAAAMRDEVKPLGLEIRAGLHTGEVEILDEDIAGIAANIGSRVSALAGGGEILVSHTVKDLVAGSGIEFASPRTEILKGVPGEWRLFPVTSV